MAEPKKRSPRGRRGKATGEPGVTPPPSPEEPSEVPAAQPVEPVEAAAPVPPPEPPPGLASLSDLEQMLTDGARFATAAQMSDAEVDALIADRKRIEELLAHSEATKLERVAQLDQMERLEVSADDYDRLLKEGVIPSTYASYVDQYKRVDQMIAQLEAIPNITSLSAVQLENLKVQRGKFHEWVKGLLEARLASEAEQRTAMRDELSANYGARAAQLQQWIDEIAANPRVAQRIAELAEADQRTRGRRILEMRMELLKRVDRYLRSLAERHNNAGNRIQEITGQSRDEIVQLLKEKDTKIQSAAFDALRAKLIEAVVTGTGKQQIRSTVEVVPWVPKSSISYKEAIDYFSEDSVKRTLTKLAEAADAQAKTALESIQALKDENRALNRLLGRQWVDGKKKDEKVPGPFYAAFEERRVRDGEARDAAVRTQIDIARAAVEAPRKAQAEAEAKLKREIADIIARGGFPVEMPIHQLIAGKMEQVGTRRGAVRLEKTKTAKKKDAVRVAEFAGIEGLRVGQVSGMNFESYPLWVRDAARAWLETSAAPVPEPPKQAATPVEAPAAGATPEVPPAAVTPPPAPESPETPVPSA